ncbi:hypothetical protein EVAR_59424_1 [Eumeta japonica]|uniref:Uncharacterized protein n=1 Tax=Eumeta variegata TaxID=151549 RepID=A0A4C1Z2H1_EUMVA|nr:hypothetical protein EVAR_59424_1 [Eumeta japonica]
MTSLKSRSAGSAQRRTPARGGAGGGAFIATNHLPILLRMGPPAGGCPNTTIKIIDWNRMSTALEEIDTPTLNSVPDDINITDEVDPAIGALTTHVRTVVENNELTVPASSDH